VWLACEKQQSRSDPRGDAMAGDPIQLDAWSRVQGSPTPLGATWIDSVKAWNFTLYSTDATSVTLLLYGSADFVNPIRTYELDPAVNKTVRVWHVLVSAADAAGAAYYAFKVGGPYNPSAGQLFDSNKVLLDPYARGIFLPPDFSRVAACSPGANDGKAALGILPAQGPSPDALPSNRPVPHTHDLIVYELHVRNFTNDPSSGLDDATRGTYAGVIAKIPYLKELGITAVEMMPIHQWDPQEGSRWGYMTLGFFAAHNGYARGGDAHNALAELRQLVDALHAAGIEVILDVVYNHTTEGNQLGPNYSFRGIDNSTYYLLNPDNYAEFINDSGCGNDTRTAHPAVRQMVTDSLRYWAYTLDVDGFRFDLASILTRDETGAISLDPPVISEIGSDRRLSTLRLIAEAWDPAAYELGRGFPGLTWRQWNGKFRDDVRSFVKGDDSTVTALMTRLYGSTDLFSDDTLTEYRPCQSVNFIDCHDGLCMYDLVAYDNDGQLSWNCVSPGQDANSPAVGVLRRQQVKNFCTLLMLSNGTPMFSAGDEFVNTQQGNDNPYNLDDPTVWLNWNLLAANQDIFRFFKYMIAFRKAHPSIGRSTFWNQQNPDVQWYGIGATPDESADSHSLAYLLKGATAGDADIYVMINAYWQALDFTIQEGAATDWRVAVDTSRESPDDIFAPGSEPAIASMTYNVQPRSVVVLLHS
jgi:isoamylase